mmetsp:Transcript_9681/g.35923  ORF Transcript_9681/g.35923 Transcript_9681/m.35923 type:complete len:243 (-) Transcript_9681:2791-3519(-)
MSNLEQQQDEIEALQSIYPDEFTIISEQSPIKYEINIPLIPTDNIDEDDDEQLKAIPRLTMHFIIPEDYPESAAPEFSLQSLQLQRNTIADLSDILKETCDENAGDVLVFSLIQRAQDWYEDILEEQNAQKEKETDDSLLNRHMTDQEANFSTSFIGHPVTKENFLEWKDKFDAEMAAKREEEHEKRMSRGAKHQSKLSGREYFEQKDSQWIQNLEQTETLQKATLEHIDDDLFLDDEDEDD